MGRVQCAPMDILKRSTDRTGRRATDVAGVVKVYDEQEALDLTVTGVFPARTWAKAFASSPPPAPVVETSPPNGRGTLDKFPWEK